MRRLLELSLITELILRERPSLFDIYARVPSHHGLGPSRPALARQLPVLEDVGVIHVQCQVNTQLHSLDTTPLRKLMRGWLSTSEEPR